MLKLIKSSYIFISKNEVAEEIEVQKTYLFLFKFKRTYRRIMKEIFMYKKGQYIIDEYNLFISENEVKELFKKEFS